MTPGVAVWRKDFPGVGIDFSKLQVALTNPESKEWSARTSDALPQILVEDLPWQKFEFHTVYMTEPP